MINLNFRPLNQNQLSDFYVVGKATGNTTTTKFLVVRSWTFGEIAQTAFLFLIAATLIFNLIWTIFRKKNTYDL